MRCKKRWLLGLLVLGVMMSFLVSCSKKDDDIKISVSMGVGPATRWALEKEYMEARAKELGVNIEVRLNKGDGPKTEEDDCKEMLEAGTDVLIVIPRDANKVETIFSYAKKENVPVISYARTILNEKVDLFVGYDSNRIGQRMGQYLAEMVFEGDYILLKGDENDNNAVLLYDGAMRYIDPIRSKINVLLDESVPGWDPALAKEMVKEAVAANQNQVDAILAPNDKIAGACAEALEELGVEKHVVITGMDAELDAAKRIVAGTQDATIYMDLKILATTAIDEAYHMAKGEKVNVNAEFDNQKGDTIPSNLITGQLVTKENLDKVLIEGGFFTKEQVYEDTAK